MATQCVNYVFWPPAELSRIGNPVHPENTEDRIVVSSLLTALVEGGDVAGLTLEFTVSSSVGQRALRNGLSAALAALDKSVSFPTRVQLPIEIVQPT